MSWWLWALLFAAIFVVGGIVFAVLTLRAYRKFRALLDAVGDLGGQVSGGLELLAQVGEPAIGEGGGQRVQWSGADAATNESRGKAI